MQVRYVKTGDFRQITRNNLKTSTVANVSTYFGCKFITLSVHLCLQHVYRDAARRAVRQRQLILLFISFIPDYTSVKSV